MLRNEIAANQPSNNVRGKEGNKKKMRSALCPIKTQGQSSASSAATSSLPNNKKKN